MLTVLGAIGFTILAFLQELGRAAIFAGRGTSAALAPPSYFGQVWQQVIRIGYLSLPVVGLTAVFTGAALALNIYAGGVRFNAESFMANIVVLGITRELGPVLAALMLAGRVSAAIAAEIGTMRVTEQIDAMSTLSVNPYKYLVAPRLIAGVLCLPLLVIVADAIGVFGGYLVATEALGFDGQIHMQRTLDFMTTDDVVTGLIKAAVFGFIITLMGCYHGFNSRGGAQGVGRATTYAVVNSAILIFASNYVLTSIFVET